LRNVDMVYCRVRLTLILLPWQLRSKVSKFPQLWHVYTACTPEKNIKSTVQLDVILW